MNPGPSIVWFRLDLRLSDNPALAAAISRGGAILPVFIWAPEEEQDWQPGAASRWWLHQSLNSLQSELGKLRATLLIRRGASLDSLRELIRESGAEAVFWNRRYEPAVVARDAKITAALQRQGLQVESCKANLLFEPWELQTQGGACYKVFTPYWRACQRRMQGLAPLSPPKKLRAVSKVLPSLPIAALELEPKIDWAAGIRGAWQPGEAGARRAVENFLTPEIGVYPEARDRPASAATSRLSPYLHFGEISPRQVWQEAQKYAAREPRRGVQRGVEAFLRQLIWREFAYHLLYHFPQTPLRPLRPDFERFPWREDNAALRAWQRGSTGYPIVDAGMRELWTTGWMHNRVRMIVASFLVKDLLIPWQAGARWFWETLVDADLANNTLGWQWASGCGADAAPYFRIFNPRTQGQKFDPKGGYVRYWVPELAKLSDKWLHRPWEAPAELLAQAGVVLEKTYPAPIVDHSQARALALRAFETLKHSR